MAVPSWLALPPWRTVEERTKREAKDEKEEKENGERKGRDGRRKKGKESRKGVRQSVSQAQTLFAVKRSGRALRGYSSQKEREREKERKGELEPKCARGPSLVPLHHFLNFLSLSSFLLL